MPELFIFPSGAKGSEFLIWSGSGYTAVLPEGAIQEARDYILELRNTTEPLAVDLFIDDELIEALRAPDATTARWRWSVGFNAGSVTVRLDFKSSKGHRFELITDPDLRKLTRAHFDKMVGDILEDTYALFSLSSFKTGIARGAGKDIPPIARLEFLHSRMSEIEKVVHDINSRPVRTLQATETWIPYYQAKAVTSIEILRSFRSGHIVKENSSPSRLPATLKGSLPAKIRKTIKTVGLNIKEHRDIKWCLKTWASFLTVIADRLASYRADDGEIKKTQQHWANRCRALARRLLDLLKLPLFDDVSELTSPVVVTSIYRRVVPYRKFFILYRDINLGLARISGDFLQIPLARTWELYELWCFLRLLRATTVCYGTAGIDLTALFKFAPDKGSLTLSSGSVTVPITAEYSLSFKRNYREYWLASDQRGSYSRTMTPDMTLTHKASTGPAEQLVVLDAKYRINAQLNDAIASIHMYRDAIVESDASSQIQHIVIAAYLLSPHIFTNGRPWMNMDMPGRLFHPDYRSTFKFGAITLRPGMPLTEICNALNLILKDAGAA